MRRLHIVLLVFLLASGVVQAAGLDEERAPRASNGTPRGSRGVLLEALRFVELCRNTPERQPNLSLIYWRLKIREAAEKDFDAARYAPYVAGLQNKDGGFGLWPKDVSTAQGTLFALTVLAKAGTEATDQPACVKYLKSCLAQEAAMAKWASDIVVQREIYSSLVGLALLGAEVGELDRYLALLEQDDQAWGIYYRVSAAKAFGRPIADPGRWIERLKELAANQKELGVWLLEDKHYALEAASLLDAEADDFEKVRKHVRMRPYRPWGRNLSQRFVQTWRYVRMSKLLGRDLDWLDDWVERMVSIEPVPVGGYGAVPGTGNSGDASILARRLLRDISALEAQPALAEDWREKQTPEGYYQSSPERRRRWTESEVLGLRIDETLQALRTLSLAGVEPADPDALIQWLNELAGEQSEDLDAGRIMELLECFSILGRRPENASQVAERLQARFEEDPVMMAEILSVTGAQGNRPQIAKRLRAMLDRVRYADLPIEVSVLARTCRALDSLDEGYGETAFFLRRLDRYQNPDGGVRKPENPHSNIFDTIAALRLSKLLPTLQSRHDARR